MVLPLLLPCVLLAWLGDGCHGDVLGNAVDFKRLLPQEAEVIRVLDEYLAAEQARILELQQNVDYLRNEDLHQAEEADGLLASWFSLERFTVHWRSRRDAFFRRQPTEAAFAERVNASTSNYPSTRDFHRLVESLCRTMDLYGLNVSAMAEGAFTAENVSLDAADCFFLGRAVFDMGDAYHAILWLEYALHKVASMGDVTMTKALIYHYLHLAYYNTKAHENYVQALRVCYEWQKAEPADPVPVEIAAQYEFLIQQTIKSRQSVCDESDDCDPSSVTSFLNALPNVTRPVDEYEGETYQKYQKLCRGENQYRNHKLSCTLRRHHPIYYIAPLKEETLHEDPPIRMYYDVMTEKERMKILEYAVPRLNRSVTLETQFSTNLDTRTRLSQTAWVPDFDTYSERATLKSTTLANLTTECCSPFQIVLYGAGGHYDPHLDCANAETFGLSLGDRTATVIHYLSDVEAGGYTVFPHLGIQLKPQKYACAVWYNLKKSGAHDFRTEHAGCPVLSGTKWIANKWIHEYGQVFARPCGLSPDE